MFIVTLVAFRNIVQLRFGQKIRLSDAFIELSQGRKGLNANLIGLVLVWQH
jgi:hypothetical protein